MKGSSSLFPIDSGGIYVSIFPIYEGNTFLILKIMVILDKMNKLYFYQGIRKRFNFKIVHPLLLKLKMALRDYMRCMH